MHARILVVDDEPAICEMLARMLRSAGYEVAKACHAEAGWDLITSAGSFDMVVTDSRMPGMSGVEFIRRLREHNPGLPIIHISGSHAGTAYDLPSNVRTLFKPFDLPELLPTVRQLLAA
ncbi:MAG TPA: response regulator [Gemmatimonadales bacterium]|nr:response regulator [Gemmatimonadales bacterium]